MNFAQLLTTPYEQNKTLHVHIFLQIVFLKSQKSLNLVRYQKNLVLKGIKSHFGPDMFASLLCSNIKYESKFCKIDPMKEASTDSIHL